MNGESNILPSDDTCHFQMLQKPSVVTYYVSNRDGMFILPGSRVQGRNEGERNLAIGREREATKAFNSTPSSMKNNNHNQDRDNHSIPRYIQIFMHCIAAADN